MPKTTLFQVRAKGDPDIPKGGIINVTSITATHYVGTWGKYAVRVRKDHASKVKRP